MAHLIEEGFDEDPSDYDALVTINSYEKAEQYVKTIMLNATTLQIEGIIKALYKVSRRGIDQIARERLPAIIQKGGSRQDVAMYKLLGFLDTIHDFAESESDIIRIMWLLEVDLPEELPIGVLHNEKAVVSILSNTKTLQFNGREVNNPVYGAKILKTFDIESAFNDDPEMTLEKLFDKQHRSLVGKLSSGAQQELVTLDIVTPTTVLTNDQGLQKTYGVLKLKQIAHLIGIMRTLYGHVMEFQVDCTNQHLIVLVCALDWVSKALLNYFRTEPAFKNIDDIKAKLKALIAEVDVSVSWTVRYSDTNLFDAAVNTAISLPYDERPTGPIYTASMPYQVTLRGIRQEPHNQTYVDVTFIDSDDTATDFAIRNKEATQEFSINTIGLLAIADPRPLFGNSKPLRNYVSVRSRPLQYAIKRAGDWGQVEHCKKYNKVFVTCDKMAALYAWYRKVPFIFMRTQQHQGTMTERGVPDFFTYSWCLSRRHF